MTIETPDPAPRWLARWRARPLTYVLMGLGILLLDLLGSHYLLFPVLFVLPISLSAWYCKIGWAYAFALLLPFGRSLTTEFVHHDSPLFYIVVNALVRMTVLTLLAYLVGRTARQTEALKQRLAGLVTMCAWSHTVEYEGEWVSFEEYLKRRFNLDTSHGISSAEAEKAFGKPAKPPEA